MSAAGILRDGGTVAAGTADLVAAGDIVQTEGTIAGGIAVNETASAGNIIENGGTIAAPRVDLVAGQNILIGESAFTAAVLARAPGAIDQTLTPLLPLSQGAQGGIYEASPAYQNHVFVSATTLDLTAPLRIVSENTGTVAASPNGYDPEGIVLTQTGTPLPVAIAIDGGPAGSGTPRPQVVDLFVQLVQYNGVVEPTAIADSAQIVFGPDTAKSNTYEINGCVIENFDTCTITSFTIKPLNPAKQADFSLVAAPDRTEDQLDLSISAVGNDEIWDEGSP